MTRDRIAFILALVALPISPVGFIIARQLDAFPSTSGFEQTVISNLAAMVFAVPLFISALINSGIVLTRYRNGTASYAPRRYPLWQAIVIVLGLAWIACIVVGDRALTTGFIIGILLALTSITTCVFAARREVLSKERQAARLAARSPAEARRALVVSVVIPLGVVCLITSFVLIAQNVEVAHRSCTLTGGGNFTFGTDEPKYEVSSTNCGRFVLSAEATKQFSVDELLYSRQKLDITSRGFDFGLPPVPIAINFAPSE